MKFVSKNANLRVVLRHSIPAEPITGRQMVPGLYTRFQDGMATVKDEETVKLMLAHPGFGKDYIKLEEEENDPFKMARGSAEPEHDIIDIDHGYVGKTINPKPLLNLTREQKLALQKYIDAEANKKAMGLATEMIKDLVSQATTASENKKEEAPVVEEKTPEVKEEAPKLDGPILETGEEEGSFIEEAEDGLKDVADDSMNAEEGAEEKPKKTTAKKKVK